MDSQKESCPTKTLLLASWQSAAEMYSKAVAELSRQVGVLPKADYERLRDVSEAARKQSLDAQATLERHIIEHGCGEIDSSIKQVSRKYA